GRRRRLTRPPVRRRAVATADDLDRALQEELASAIEPAREAPVRVLLLEEPEATGRRTRLVLGWFHPLMDPRGGQNLLAHLCHLDEHPGAAPWGADPPAFEAVADRRPLRERGALARRSLAHMRTLAPVPPISLASTQSASGRARFRQAAFFD